MAQNNNQQGQYNFSSQTKLPSTNQPVVENDGIIETLDTLFKKIPSPIRTTVGTALDWLGRPGAATAGAILAGQQDRSVLDAAMANLKGERRDDFDKVLAEAGVEDGWGRTAAGFGLDLAVDPLNLLGVGAVKGAISAAGKAAKLPVMADKIGDTLKSSAVVQDLGKKFVPYFDTNLPVAERANLGAIHGREFTKDEFKKSRMLLDQELATIPERTSNKLVKQYAGVEPIDRLSILQDIEAGAGRTPEIDQYVLQARKQFDDVFDKEVAAKVQKLENYLPDYTPYDFSSVKKGSGVQQHRSGSTISAKNPFAKHRTIETIEDALVKGAEPDIALASLPRLAKSENLTRTSEYLQDIANNYGISKKDPRLPNGWVGVKTNMESPLKDVISEYRFPPQIAKELSRLMEINPKQGAIGENLDKVLAAWRKVATIYRPGFHGTNFAGNTYNAMLGGQTNPLSYARAAKWVAGNKPTSLGNYTSSEIDDFMAKFGLMGSSFIREMGETVPKKELARKLAETITPPSKLTKVARAVAPTNIGQKVEGFSKKAFFLDRVSKGDTLEDALLATNKYLFNYDELTNFERKVMRKIFPFYTFTRKNLPLQIESTIKQPYKLAGVSKAMNAIEDESADNYVPPEHRPAFMQQSDAIQLPTDGENATFNIPNLPFEDLNKIPLPSNSDGMAAVKELASMLTPLLKPAIELTTNTSLFTGRQLRDKNLGITEDLQRNPEIIAALPDAIESRLPNVELVAGRGGKSELQMPFIQKYIIEQIPSLSTVGKTSRAVSDPTGENVNPMSGIGLMTGLRLNTLTPQDIRDAKAINIRNEVNEKKAKAKQRILSKDQIDSLWNEYQNWLTQP